MAKATGTGLMSLSTSSELMPNQVAGKVLPEQKAVTVTATTQQEPMLFAVDAGGKFTLTLSDRSSSTGWAQIDLTSQLSTLPGLGASPVVQAFTTAQDSDGGIWVVLSAASALGAASQIFLSPKMPNSGQAADWASFSSALVERSVPPATVISDFALGQDDDNIGAPLIVAVGGLNKNDLTHYQINPNPNDTSWTYLPLELPQNATACLSVAVGVAPGLGRGVYTLSAINTVINLTFTTLPQVFGGHVVTKSLNFNLPAGFTPAAIASVSVDQGQTELYVAGNGIHRFSLAQQASSNLPGVSVATADEVSGVTKLLVTSDSVADAIDIWGLNGSDQLFHVSGAKITDDYTWLTPLMVQSEVTALSAYRALDTDNVTDISGLLLGRSDGSLSLMAQDSRTSLWRPQTVSLLQLDSALTLNTYTTRVALVDADGVPWADQTVLIRASLDCAALVNGQYYALKSSATKTAQTDAEGTLTIVLETADLAAPVYTFTTNGMVLVSDPAGAIAKTLRGSSSNGISGDEIAKAQRSDDKPLFPNGANPNDCGAAATLVASLVKAQNSLPVDGSLRKNAVRPHLLAVGPRQQIISSVGVRFTPLGPQILQHAEVLAHRTEAVQDAASWVSAGDLFAVLSSMFDSVVGFYVDQLEDAWAFVVEVAGQHVQFLFDVGSQVFSAFNYVLQKTLGLDLNDLISWLGFLFGWDDILMNQKALANVVNVGLAHAAASMDGMHDDIVEAFQTVRGLITSNQLLIDKSNAMFGERTRSQPDADDPSASSPQSNWGAQQLKSNADNATATSITFGDISGLFTNLAANQIQILDNLVSSIQDVIVNNFSQLSWGELLTTVLEIVGITLLDAAENCILTFVDATAVLIQLFSSLLNARLEIPVLTYFFEEVICGGDGTQFTMLNAVTLLAAIPTTILFKAITGENMFSPAQAGAVRNAPNWKTLMSALGSSDLSAGASRRDRGLIPSRHLGGPALITGPWQSPVMRAGAVFQILTGFTRSFGAIAYILRELFDTVPIVRDFVNQWKIGFDWTTYVFASVNMACAIEEAEDPSSARVVIDSLVTYVQILIRARDTVVAIYRAGNNHANPPFAPALTVVESAIGVGMIVGTCTSLALQVEEPRPDGAPPELWNGILATKFIQNGTSSIYRTTALGTLSTGNLRVATQIIRGALLGIRALANLARAGMETKVAFAEGDVDTSDTRGTRDTRSQDPKKGACQPVSEIWKNK